MYYSYLLGLTSGIIIICCMHACVTLMIPLCVINNNSARFITLQVSFSGCLIENLNNLADNNHIYAPGWNKKYSDAIRSLKTSGGFPKLDFVSFTYHHALTTLIDK